MQTAQRRPADPLYSPRIADIILKRPCYQHQADARAAALERVPGATDTDIKMELDFDDGQYIYEGDIIYDGKEYEFEIDANTGNFLKWSEEKW